MNDTYESLEEEIRSLYEADKFQKVTLAWESLSSTFRESLEKYGNMDILEMAADSYYQTGKSELAEMLIKIIINNYIILYQKSGSNIYAKFSGSIDYYFYLFYSLNSSDSLTKQKLISTYWVMGGRNQFLMEQKMYFDKIVIKRFERCYLGAMGILILFILYGFYQIYSNRLTSTGIVILQIISGLALTLGLAIQLYNKNSKQFIANLVAKYYSLKVIV